MIDFYEWLESTSVLDKPSPIMEPNTDEIQESQWMWMGSVEALPYFNNNMNLAIAHYVIHMAEMEEPEKIGKQLGMMLIHAPDYKPSYPVDRNKIFKILQIKEPIHSQTIIRAANQAYATYAPRLSTRNTIQS